MNDLTFQVNNTRSSFLQCRSRSRSCHDHSRHGHGSHALVTRIAQEKNGEKSENRKSAAEAAPAELNECDNDAKNLYSLFSCSFHVLLISRSVFFNLSITLSLNLKQDPEPSSQFIEPLSHFLSRFRQRYSACHGQLPQFRHGMFELFELFMFTNDEDMSLKMSVLCHNLIFRFILFPPVWITGDW